VPAADIHAYMTANVPAAAVAQVDKATENIDRLLGNRTRLLPQIDANVATSGSASLPSPSASP
jgi:hypothetical protein